MEPYSQEPVAQVVAERIAGEDRMVRGRARREVLFDAYSMAVTALFVGTNAFEKIPLAGEAFRNLIDKLPPIDGFQLNPEHLVNVATISMLFLMREGVRDSIHLFWVAQRADIFKKKLKLALAQGEA